MSKYNFVIRGQVVADGFATIEADSQAEANAKFAELESELITWEYDPANLVCGAVVKGVSVDGGGLVPMNWEATGAGFWYAQDVNTLRKA